MNDTFHFVGRGKLSACEKKPDVIQADAGHVFCLVVTVADLEFVSYYTRMAAIDAWGMRLVNPFRRLSYSSLRYEFANYLPKDLFIFCPARLQMIPEEEWMLREE